MVIVAVKPHIMSTVLKEVSSKVTKDQLIISLAAGTRLKTMSEVCILHKKASFMMKMALEFTRWCSSDEGHAKHSLQCGSWNDRHFSWAHGDQRKCTKG